MILIKKTPKTGCLIFASPHVCQRHFGMSMSHPPLLLPCEGKTKKSKAKAKKARLPNEIPDSSRGYSIIYAYMYVYICMYVCIHMYTVYMYMCMYYLVVSLVSSCPKRQRLWHTLSFKIHRFEVWAPNPGPYLFLLVWVWFEVWALS